MVISEGDSLLSSLGSLIAIPVAGTIQVLLDEYYFDKKSSAKPEAESKAKAKASTQAKSA